MTTNNISSSSGSSFPEPNEMKSQSSENPVSSKAQKILTDSGTQKAQTPFYGKKGIFKLSPEENWEISDHGVELCRKLKFVSNTEGSFFKEVSLFGYNDGSVALSVDYDKNDKRSVDFLKALNLTSKSGGSYFIARKPDDKQALFKILEESTELPDSHRKMVADLIKAESWDKVTPLKNREDIPRPPRYIPINNL